MSLFLTVTEFPINIDKASQGWIQADLVPPFFFLDSYIAGYYSE